jgi:hypothetical protein
MHHLGDQQRQVSDDFTRRNDDKDQRDAALDAEPPLLCASQHDGSHRHNEHDPKDARSPHGEHSDAIGQDRQQVSNREDCECDGPARFDTEYVNRFIESPSATGSRQQRDARANSVPRANRKPRHQATVPT